MFNFFRGWSNQKEAKCDDFTDVLTCSACNKEITDPRVLPCKHSMCSSCAKSLSRVSMFNLPCSTCSAQFRMSQMTVDYLPSNEFLCKLKAVKFSKLLELRCNNCNDMKAKVYCQSCEAYLCRVCLKEHNKKDGNKSHQILQTNSTSICKDIYKTCLVHGQTIDIHCKNCDAFICSKCAIFSHNQHNFVDVTNKVKELANTMATIIPEMEKISDNLDVKINEMEIEKYRDKDKTVHEIQEHISNLKTEIDKYGQDLLAEVDQYYEGYYEMFNDFLNSLKLERDTLNKKLICMKEFKENLNPNTVTCLNDHIKSKHMLIVIKKNGLVDFPASSLKFHHPNITSTFNGEKLVGFVCDDRLSSVLQQMPFNYHTPRNFM